VVTKGLKWSPATHKDTILLQETEGIRCGETD